MAKEKNAINSGHFETAKGQDRHFSLNVYSCDYRFQNLPLSIRFLLGTVISMQYRPNFNDNRKTLTMALQLSSREKYLRQFLGSSCDSKLATPDLILVCKDGESLGHKFLVLGLLPELRHLLCDLCENSH